MWRQPAGDGGRNSSGGGGGFAPHPAPRGRGGRRRRNRLIQERCRAGVDLDDGEDVLASYYKSKLPADSLADADACAAPPDQQQQELTQQQQQATVRADELIALAVQHLVTDARTPHLLVRTPDILWLHAGGSAELVIRQKCEQLGEVQRLKVFPRQAFACVSFVDAKTAASAQIALDNHTFYCRPLAVGFLQQFLSREAILACQHLPPSPQVPVATAPSDDAELLAATPVAGLPELCPLSMPAGAGAGADENLDEAVESYLQFLLGD